jgi:hypothetical protein
MSRFACFALLFIFMAFASGCPFQFSEMEKA